MATTLVTGLESLESKISIEDSIDNDLIPHNAKLIRTPWFIDWVKEYMNNFVKDNDMSIIFFGDSMKNLHEYRGNEMIQAMENDHTWFLLWCSQLSSFNKRRQSQLDI